MSGFLSRSPTLVLELFAASHLYVECLELILAPLLDVSSLREPTFSVVLFDPHAAKRVGFKLAIPQLGRVVDDPDGTDCTLAVTRERPCNRRSFLELP